MSIIFSDKEVIEKMLTKLKSKLKKKKLVGSIETTRKWGATGW